jgi:hypothetical protein
LEKMRQNLEMLQTQNGQAAEKLVDRILGEIGQRFP